MACSADGTFQTRPMRLALLSGGYPPDFDAIGQYTRRLAETLVEMGNEVTVFSGRSAAAAASPLEQNRPLIPVERFFDPLDPGSLRGLGAACRKHGKLDWLIVQFNPFGFGPRGWCPALPGALAALRREQGVRIAIYFHETHVPAWPLKFLLMLSWQYPNFARLAAMADTTFISTTRWKKQVCRWRPEHSCHAVPVGSNLPLCTSSKADGREVLGLPDAPVLGVFGNAHPSRLIHWIAEAAAEIRKLSPQSILLYVGKDGAEISAACASAGIGFQDHGMLPDKEASLRLRAMDVLLSPFVDGISARRSSAIAALQHDLPVLTTFTPNSDECMLQHPLVLCSPVEEGAPAFVKLAGRWIMGDFAGREAPDFAASPFAWKSIGATITRELERAQKCK
jgi:glycosyltransferase involved in cell wall biosynthesis